MAGSFLLHNSNRLQKCCHVLLSQGREKGWKTGSVALHRIHHLTWLSVDLVMGEQTKLLDDFTPSPWCCLLINDSLHCHFNRWIHFWRSDIFAQIIEKVATSPLPGYVNGMCIATCGRFLISATGKEHRLGRWSPIPQGRNSLSILQLPLDLAQL